ncbi:ArnT family glycosyltransferase [Psychroflexus sp. MES1-P1E]|uniref:ArnT family glycosyltransferase n=1 Tax=Psychroflexus sp. MES1-P1E TaxID=2058320 RepID=UPI000C7D3712|nr:glycosyltransferase family 39 protein [Psychroflexus sp. MES1-P1E]PKG42999.1 dolichyl-phosphate-mannose--protein mannosyltransferase [Psychroflexus sp. MES1-P1E]
MLKLIYKYPVITLILVCVILFFFNLGVLPVSIMEARNFNVAREMLTENNWLLTTMNAIPRYEKPPFPAWFTTMFSQFNIKSVFLYRLPTSIVATFGVIFSYYLFKSLAQTKKVALIASLVLATSFYYVAIRFEAPSDTYTHAFMIAGLLFMTKAIQSSTKSLLYISLAILGIGISVLSKGPVSLYAVFLPFIIAYFSTYSYSKKAIIISISTFLLGIALGSTWYWYIEFINPKVLNQIANEETSNWSSYNVRPFYYYWSFFIQSGIWTVPALISLAYPYFKTKVDNKKLYKFSWLWTVLAVVLLSIIPEKKSRYLVPVLFPLALNLAQVLLYQFRTKKLDIVSRIAMKFHYVLIFCIGISIVAIPLIIEVRTTSFWIWYYTLVALMFAISAVIFFNYSPLKCKILFLSNILLIMVVTSAGIYGIQFLKQNDKYNALTSAELQPSFLYYYKSIQPEVIWGSNRVSKPLDFSKNFTSQHKVQVIVENVYVKEFKQQIPSEYEIKSVKAYDRNYFKAADNRRHDRRKVFYLYTLKQKN